MFRRMLTWMCGTLYHSLPKTSPCLFAMTRTFCFIVCFAFIGILLATDYYVDSELGNDTYAGLSPQQAWGSLEAVNNANLTPGDSVLFKRGGIWRGQFRPQSGEAERFILYGAYGDSPDKPQIRGSVPLDKPTDWINEGNGIWVTKSDTVRQGNEVFDFLGLTWFLHQEGGADTFMRTAPQRQYNHFRRINEYAISSRSSGTRSNHIQFIVRGFKIERGKHYLLCFLAKSTKPFTIPSIRLSEPSDPWGGLGEMLDKPVEVIEEWKEYAVLFRCDAEHSDARFTISLGGALPEGAEFSFVPLPLCEAVVETNGINTDVGNIILNGSKAAFKRWTREDLKAQDDFWCDLETNRVYYYSERNPATMYKSIEAALHWHVVDHSARRYIIFNGLDIRYGAAHGFGGTKADHIIYRNLDISWIGGADQYREGGAGRRVRFGNGIEFWSDASDCLVEDCRLWEIYDAALTNQGSGTNVQRRLTYRRNLIWNCEYSFEYWNRGPESITEDILFENNICVDAGYGWGYAQRPDKNGRHLMIYQNTAKTDRFIIRNNIFYNAKDGVLRIDSDMRNTLTMENNTYWQPVEKDFMFWLTRTRYKTEQFAEYQNDLGLDRSSTFGLPDLSQFPALPDEIRSREW